MGLDKKNLDKIIDFVKAVKDTPGNEEFIANLREVLGMNNSAAQMPFKLEKETDESVSFTKQIDNNIRHIKDILCIRSENSIDYEFISETEYPHLKRQLIVDNSRMEDAILDTREKSEYIRFYNFCANAFYQIENIINHYYYVKFSSIEECVNFVTTNTGYLDKEGNLKYNEDGTIQGQYNPSRAPQAINDIEISYKLTAFMRNNGFDNKDEQLFSNLRNVRNLGAHRCMSIWEKQSLKQLGDDKLKPIFLFYQYNTPDNVRRLVEVVVEAVKNSLKK
jgi:hypothetical protein